jgi:hypothetical protein
MGLRNPMFVPRAPGASGCVYEFSLFTCGHLAATLEVREGIF